MTGSLTHLLVAALAFTGGHFLFVSSPLRSHLVARLGEKGFQGAFSLYALATFVWLLIAYAHAPLLPLWGAPEWLRLFTLALMLPAAILLFVGLRPNNPTALTGGPEAVDSDRLGGFAITRQPMLWAFTLWAVAHIPVNGDGASLILFGAILLLALPGTCTLERRLARQYPQAWQRLAATTSNVPLAALLGGRVPGGWRAIGWLPLAGGAVLYLVLIALHPWLTGVSLGP